MIMIVKTPGSQMGSPAAAEEGGEAMGGGRGESGERSEVQEKQHFFGSSFSFNLQVFEEDSPFVD